MNLDDGPDVFLMPYGSEGERFRVGWLEGKSRIGTRSRCTWPKGTLERAASMAAVAYHKELSK